MRAKGAQFDNLSINDICALFHVSRRSIANWIKDGCMRNPDNTMSAYQVHEWLLQRERKKKEDNEKLTLKDQKLVKDIELTDVKILKAKDELIERSVHEDTLASRSKTESDYWSNAIDRNVVYMAMQPKETLAVMLRSFLCKGTSNIVSE